MSRLADLIAELCPYGVPFVELGSVLSYEQPTRYLVKSVAYDDRYPTPVLTAGQTFILGYSNETDGLYLASKQAPIILFDDFTTVSKWVDFPFKAKSSAAKILTPKPEAPILFRFAWHWIQHINYTPTDHRRQWIQNFSHFKIPQPPLEVQHEIVRILDKFVILEAELEAELELQCLRLEQVRGRLLGAHTDSQAVLLGEVCEYSRERTSVGSLTPDNYTGVDNLLPGKGGRIASKYLPPSGTVTCHKPGDILLGNIRPYLKKIWKADRSGAASNDVLVISIREESRGLLHPDYLYHILASEEFFTYSNRRLRGSTIPRGDKAAIMRYPFSLPPLSVQCRTATYLNAHHQLAYDLQEGLPAEISARRKQYEYYRAQLLDFKELPS